MIAGIFKLSLATLSRISSSASDSGSGFYDQAILKLLEGKRIDYIISARLTKGLQQAIIRDARWFALETGLELADITYQAHGWDAARRIVMVRQSIKRKTAPGKTLSLFADDPDIQGWRYGAMVMTSLSLPAVEVWRSYRGRAECENRIKELKNGFGLDSFNLIVPTPRKRRWALPCWPTT